MSRALPMLLFGAGMVFSPNIAGQQRPDESSAEIDAPDAGAFPAMTGLLDEAVRNLAKLRNEEGLRLLASKDYPAALERFRQATDLNAENAEYANNLGYIYYLLGNLEDAERFLRRSIEIDPSRHAAYLNLADLLGKEGESPKRLTEAAQVLKKAREMHGNKSKVILRQARVSALLGLFQDAARFYREYAVSVRKVPDKVLVEIGDFFRGIGMDDEAMSWYQKVSDADEWGKSAATRIWDIEVEKQAKQYGWAARTDTVSDKAKALYEKADNLISQKEWEEARRLLEEAVDTAPGYVDARVRLAEVLRRTGKNNAAELAYLRALALDSGKAEIFAAIADLYMDAKKEGRAAEAVLYYTRALDLRPNWIALHFKLARALQDAGDLDRALHHLEIFLGQTQQGKSRTAALRLKKSIAKVLGAAGRKNGGQRPVAGDDAGMNGLSEELISALNRARAHLAKGRPDAAMAELQRLPKERQGTLVMNLEAKILNVTGRTEEAAAILKSSLKIDPGQAEVHEQLGSLNLSMGKIAAARAHYKTAESLGDLPSKFHLAKLDAVRRGGTADGWLWDLWAVGRLLSVQHRLESYLESASSSMYGDEAEALLSETVNRIRWSIGTALVLLLLTAGTSIFATRRVWGGADISTLLTRHPDAAPEVQRIFSAIRHEVLKHNTLALGGVIESIERGGPDAEEKARHFKRTITGTKDDSVAMRLDKYASELAKVGRSLGLRLNLRKKETSIALLYKGFGLLKSVTPRLGRIGQMNVVEKRRVLATLKRAFRLLNVDGYEAVQQVLGRIRMLEVDEALLRSIAVRVLREPGFIDVDVAPAAIESRVKLPLSVLISQRAFEDIIANLYRNALQSSIEMGLSPVEVGIAADLEVDDVTGFERAVFLVSDRSTKELTTEMIRGRAIEGGLGLTVDLAAKYDGTIDVVSGERGWQKAIRVKLPATPEIMESGRDT